MKLYLDNPEIAVNFEAVKAVLPGADQDRLNDRRRHAITSFSETGIPGPRLEQWKYTNLSFLAKENYPIAAKAEQSDEIRQYFDQSYITAIAGPVVVFVNGYFYPDLSSLPTEQGLDFSVFSQNPEAFYQSLQPSAGSSSLNNLNRALVTDGYDISIAADVTLSQPLQIIHIATSGTNMQSVRSRARIKFGQRSQATIIESFIGADDTRYWFHMVSDVILDRGATAAFAQFQVQGKKALHMTEFHSRLSDHARFNHVSLQLGAELDRSELINSFSGEDADISLSGAYLGRLKQSHDIVTRINHDQPHCRSRQLFRGVLDKGGKSAFQGKVVVARDAQKTNADQSNKTLLLDRGAVANAKPELLIYADDVKCSHGATVGEVDPDQLFYLRSRGLDEIAAKGLLTEAFVSEVFDDLEAGPVAEKFRKYTADWLRKEEMS
ncbi:MAG: Fe-S cluster assembly protein SufD [Alphaproteobacteria bacterium]|nr:Fe-S cluster assembly protein SufD [Alphaproteobacteria bacterium]